MYMKVRIWSKSKLKISTTTSNCVSQLEPRYIKNYDEKEDRNANILDQ